MGGGKVWGGAAQGFFFELFKVSFPPQNSHFGTIAFKKMCEREVREAVHRCRSTAANPPLERFYPRPS